MEFPLVTFYIASYNQEKYISDAINGAFSQDYPNLEIIISDDCSTDGTWDIIQEKAQEYKGPHKLILNRNDINIGPRKHINKLLYELSKGEIIVMSAGDDMSDSQRTSKCVDFMMDHPNVSSMSCVSQLMDENGVLYKPEHINTLSIGHVSVYTLWDYVNTNLMMHSGDSRVLRRRVIDSFPPLKWSYSEDVFLFVRSFYVGDVALIHEPLVKYRQHSDSIMGKERQRKKMKKGKYRQFEEQTVKQLQEDLQYAIAKNYIDEDHVDIVTRKVDEIINWLRPKQKTIFHRGIRRMNRIINKFLNQLDTILS